MSEREIQELNDRQEDRFAHWLMQMQKIIVTLGIQDDVQVDTKILGKAVVDYFEDINRLKDFEKIERVNVDKIYSYEAYWILRRKPIQFIQPNHLDERFYYINEKVCTVMLISKMFAEAGISMNSKGSKTDSFSELLFYNFKYRTYTQKSLELMVEAFLCGYDLKEPVNAE